MRQIEPSTKPAPTVTAKEIVALRKKMNMSQQDFAMCIRTSTETLRNWEQDKSRPNTQASLLIRLVERYPDMTERLASV